MNKNEAERIASYKEKIGYDQPVTREDLVKALEGAMQDRGLYAYFIWKAIQKLHPEVDADAIIEDAMHDYGLYKSRGLGQVNNAADALLNQTSKNGMLVFDQELTALSDDYAEKRINNCPLINAFRQVGATPEEITKLCTKLLGAADFAMLEPFADKVELSFPQTLSDCDVCLMCVKKK